MRCDCSRVMTLLLPGNHTIIVLVTFESIFAWLQMGARKQRISFALPAFDSTGLMGKLQLRALLGRSSAVDGMEKWVMMKAPIVEVNLSWTNLLQLQFVGGIKGGN